MRRVILFTIALLLAITAYAPYYHYYQGQILAYARAVLETGFGMIHLPEKQSI